MNFINLKTLALNRFKNLICLLSKTWKVLFDDKSNPRYIMTRETFIQWEILLGPNFWSSGAENFGNLSISLWIIVHYAKYVSLSNMVLKFNYFIVIIITITNVIIVYLNLFENKIFLSEMHTYKIIVHKIQIIHYIIFLIYF